MAIFSVRSIAVAVFGFVAPLLLMIQAGVGLYALTRTLSDPDIRPVATKIIPALRPQLRDVNDYIMASHINAEGVNQTVMVNKQIMKAVVMQVGFAVCSVGLMFVLLGITDGGAEGGVGSFNLKVSSTGALVFVTGAAMVAGGGLLRNDYKTLPVPNYALSPTSSESSSGEALKELQKSIERCLSMQVSDRAPCIANDYQGIKKVFEI